MTKSPSPLELTDATHAAVREPNGIARDYLLPCTSQRVDLRFIMSSGRYHGTPNSSTTTLAEEETCRAHDAPCSSARLGVAPEALTTRTGAQVHSVDEGHECCKEKGLGAEEEEVWTYPDGGLRAWLVVLGK